MVKNVIFRDITINSDYTNTSGSANHALSNSKGQIVHPFYLRELIQVQEYSKMTSKPDRLDKPGEKEEEKAIEEYDKV